MFDIGPGEIGVLIVLAIIIFGPEKLPEIARKVARVVNYLRHIANDAQSTLRRELGPEYADLDIRDLNPKTNPSSTTCVRTSRTPTGVCVKTSRT